MATPAVLTRPRPPARRSVPRLAADYTTNGSDNVTVASELNLNLVLLNLDPTASNDLSIVYAVVVTTGTPTYATTSDLTFRYKVMQY